MDDTSAYAVLVDGLRKALAIYLERRAQPPPQPTSRRLPPRRPLSRRTNELRDALQEQFPEWTSVAAEAAEQNGRNTDRRIELTAVMDLLDFLNGQGDPRELAHRIADILAGPPMPLWEYVAVDLTIEPASVPLFGDWELCRMDPVLDPALPPRLPRLLHRWAPGHLVASGFGALRRPAPAKTLANVVDDDGELIWPLISLNLSGAAPVRAFTAYLVEPGRRFVPHHEEEPWYLPAEVAAWHRAPWSLPPCKPHALDKSMTVELGRSASRIGSDIAALGSKDRRQFARAAGHLLYLAYLQADGDGGVDGSYAAFRRTVAIEALLTGRDSDHESLGRKVAQRAAVLIGTDDEERLTARQLITQAYGARSAFAHGSRAKQVDQEALARACRMVTRRWLALAALHGGQQVARMLDDALLSVTVRDGLLSAVEAAEE